MSNYLLAHDLGTSGNKAVLYGENGTLLASMLCEYPTSYPKEGYAEQDPNDWWDAVCRSTKKLLEETGTPPSKIAAVSFSGQMMGCLPVDREGKPLGNMLIWADHRAVDEEAWMQQQAGAQRGYRITGHRLSASYSAAKLLWLKNHAPEIYKKCYKILHAKDYMVYCLTGNMMTDYSDASGTNLLDIEKKVWSKELLDAFQIPPGLLPDLYPASHVAGTVTREAARRTGLLEGTPVVLGGGDGSCACVGAGVVREGKAYNILGSSSWISMVTGHPVFDGPMRTFNWLHLDPGLYTPCGTMQAAGLSYSWYKNTFAPAIALADKNTDIYTLLNQDIEKTPPGARGLLYLPYLLGERSPRWDHDARGAFVGLDITSSRAEMGRAVLEGVAFNLRIILEILQQAQSMDEITVIGGGARSDTWPQILADVWQKPVVIPEFLEEATSMGAAICAGVGVGIYDSYYVAESMNPVRKVLYPREEYEKVYDPLYRIFNRAYDQLVPVYRELAALSGK